MALPGFRDDGWLPQGHHPTTWEEIISVFGGQPGSRRAEILARLLDWRDRLRQKGIAGRLILNGSFVSAKPQRGGGPVITNEPELEVALHELASFKSLLEAMRLHLDETEPSLIPLASESYQHRIRELQEEICDYLLRQRQEEGAEAADTRPDDELTQMPTSSTPEP